MDVAEYLWERVERADAPGTLAAAMNTPAIRDSLLRKAALGDDWQLLAAAAGEAARVARSAGWSAAGPDTVAAICQWVNADQLLRGVPGNDRASTLARAVRERWAAPQEVAAALAATPPLAQEDAAAFEESLAADGANGPAREVLDELDHAMHEDPELLAYALNTDVVRDALLRHTARTGEWEELRTAALDAVEAAGAAGARTDGPEVVAALCEWMLGNQEAARERLAANAEHPLAAALEAAWEQPLMAADMLASGPPLDDLAARRFLAELDGPVNTAAGDVLMHGGATRGR